MRTLLLLAATAVFLSSCALYTDTRLHPWTGKGQFVGDGGVKENVLGLEYWRHGAPERRFQILGIVEQSRPGGTGGQLLFEEYNKEQLVQQLRTVGADGVIEIDRENLLTGFSTSTKYGTGGYDVNADSVERKVLAAFKYFE